MASSTVLQLAAGRMFDPPTSWRETRHMLDSMLRQPLIIVSPLKPISQNLLWNHTSQTASQRTNTDNKLLMRPGAWFASLAALGSLYNRISEVLVMNIRAPESWIIVLVGNLGVNSLAGAL